VERTEYDAAGTGYREAGIDFAIHFCASADFAHSPATCLVATLSRFQTEHEAMLADSVGLALLVVLDRLTPAERIAFVLHDMFDVSFDEIASIVGRSPTAARQLASRGRRRVHGADVPGQAELNQQRHVVDAFLAALRGGDFESLVAVLDPDGVVRIDETAARPGAPRVIHGAKTWAKDAVAFAHMAQAVQPMLIDGAVGLVWAPGGRLSRVLKCKIASGKIVEVETAAPRDCGTWT
jgi:hypothetical protein